MITTVAIAAHAVTFKLVAEEPEKPVVVQAPVPGGDDQKPTTDTTSGYRAANQSSAALSQQAVVDPGVLNIVPVTSDETAFPFHPEIPMEFRLMSRPSVRLRPAMPRFRLRRASRSQEFSSSTSVPSVKDSARRFCRSCRQERAPESDEARAERLRAQGGTREAVIDMAHVFKSDPEFERLRTEMLREVEIADAKAEAESDSAHDRW